MIKCLKNKILIALFLFALLFLIYFNFFENPPSISDGILGITAIILLWYTHETSLMRKEITKQNILLARPIIVIELKCINKKIYEPYFKNIGNGPAFNIDISKLKTKWKINGNNSNQFQDKLLSWDISSVPYLRKNEEKGLYALSVDQSSGLKGTVSESDDIFKFGKIADIILKYNDIEGSEYYTEENIQSAMVKKVRFG